MIHNEREYEHTRCQAAELERVLDNWPAAPPPDVLTGVWEMARRGAAWRLDDMRAELRAYAPPACGYGSGQCGCCCVSSHPRFVLAFCIPVP